MNVMMMDYPPLFVITLFCGSAAFAETVAAESPAGHLKLTLDDGAVAQALIRTL